LSSFPSFEEPQDAQIHDAELVTADDDDDAFESLIVLLLFFRVPVEDAEE
jgi:hypothetical protein